MHAEPASRHKLRGTGCLVRLIEIVQNLRAALVILTSDLGQTDPPRRFGSKAERRARFPAPALARLALPSISATALLRREAAIFGDTDNALIPAKRSIEISIVRLERTSCSPNTRLSA